MKNKQVESKRPLWDWLHDDLRKDEMKNALKARKNKRVEKKYKRWSVRYAPLEDMMKKRRVERVVLGEGNYLELFLWFLENPGVYFKNRSIYKLPFDNNQKIRLVAEILD